MELSSLKIVSISGRAYKRQLLLTQSEVATFVTFLKSVIKDDVMVISTNIGVDIYYYSPMNQLKLIKNTFLLLMIQTNKTADDFHFKTFDQRSEIEFETERMFLRLAEMPLLFKSYSKSLFHQMEIHYNNKHSMLVELFSIWQEVLLSLNYDDPKTHKLKSFLSNLQKVYIRNSCHSDFKALLEEVLRPLHEN